MSFFTTLNYYRPGEPPRVTARELAEFVAAIRDTRLTTDEHFVSFNIVCGRSIKRRGWSGTEIEQCNQGTMQNTIDRLGSIDATIHRAFVNLGTPVEQVVSRITRKDTPENEIDFTPDALSLEIGPIESFSLLSDDPIRVGWISLTIAGSGYLWPWTFQDVLKRLNATPEIKTLTDLCRTRWPVEKSTPGRRLVKFRQNLGDLWPYEECDGFDDWCWGLAESG